MIKSEQTADMNQEELMKLQQEIAEMKAPALKKYQGAFHPDEMGFFGEEGIADEDNEADHQD